MSLNVVSSSNHILTSNGYYFTPTKMVGNYFAIDENTCLWAISKGTSSFKHSVLYSYDDIVDYELLEDGSSVVKGGAGRALVGGMFFGGVGAIVGGATSTRKAKQICTNLSIKITVNNIATPVEYIKLISSATRKDSLTYRGAFQDAQEIISLLQLIRNQCAIPSSSSPEPTQQTSTVDKIRKYKALMEEGIITEDEFLFKKKQLLGM